ncbi:uncharacterized protein LOC110974050 [Acanthaster planci]|uniref:Uncharacterized protein LOC110974050 n=1 Tax=Acanthaster planci TaxID=133434 RepID=A0A8B7XLS2_ACAPL|nr:uncharacterized protein LOC110974050 [Acanthaster planci]
MKLRQSLLDKAAVLVLLLTSAAEVSVQGDASCTGISKDVACKKCSESTHKCMPGEVPIDPWLVAAAKQQRELQIDEPWDRLQMLDAHNGYNARAWGFGVTDTCPWPPPYPMDCNNYANQEFSFMDLLNMGIRALEIDNWFCYNEMRMAHLGDTIDLECSETDPLFSDGIKEIADWINLPGNGEEMVRIYMNEKYNQGNDDSVNDPLEQYLGDRILTPAELADTYGGKWPTPRQMRQAGKNVVVATGSTAGSGEVYPHGGKYIHKIYWEDKQMRLFTNYPECGTKNLTNKIRYYSDATHYGNSTHLKHDGPSNGAGVIYDFTEFVKCRVQYPATDMITPDLIKTALFTWAEGQPDPELTSESCVWVSRTDWRWYVSEDCSIELYCACQSTTDPDDWKISSSPASYSSSSDACPTGYKFSVPQDGFRHQKLKDESGGNSVWINITPWLPEKESAAPSVGQLSSTALLMSLLLGSFLRY